MESKGKRLRTLLGSGEVIIMIAVGTAHQAKLAEKTGFEAVSISGSSTSEEIFGLPDAGFITMTELVENVERICRAVSLPVMVDCDTGFGNAINARRTVDSVIRAGAAGLFIEDQVAPKRCGFIKGKEVIPLEEAVGKLRAAIDARDELDPDVVIMARTDARGAVGGGLEEAVRRAKAYRDAGVDMLYVEALRSRDEIKQVRSAVGDCWLKITESSIDPPLTLKEMKELGLCSVSCHVNQSGSIAMYDFLTEVKKQGMGAYTEFRRRIQSHPLGGPGFYGPLAGLIDLAGFPKVSEWEKKYLSPEQLKKYEQSLGAYDPRSGRGKG
jgi:2-methylisocitrate lyase-like PEP mutase family enzyme